MNPTQDAELQAIAATLPLHIEFAWEDAASIEQMIQAVTALADYAAANHQQFPEAAQGHFGMMALSLHRQGSREVTLGQQKYWTNGGGHKDPRHLIYTGLFTAYVRHHGRLKMLAAQA